MSEHAASPPASPTSPGKFSAGEALSFGWNAFKANPVPWLVWFIVVTAVGFVAHLPSTIGYVMAGDGDEFTLTTGSTILIVVGVLLFAIVAAVAGTAFMGAALRAASGEKFTVGSFFSITRLVAYVLVSVLVGIITGIGQLLIIGGLIAVYLLQFSHYALLDDNSVGPVEALRLGFGVVKANFLASLLLIIAVGAINFVGALLLGVGLLVTAPVTLIALAYAYRTAVGRATAVPA